jgi:hypothetical protein
MGAFSFSSLSLALSLARPTFGGDGQEIFLAGWLVGFGLGAWALALQLRWERPLLLLAACLAGANAIAFPALVISPDALGVLGVHGLRTQDHRALILALFFLLGIPAGALFSSFFRRVQSARTGSFFLFLGGALGSLYLEGLLSAQSGRGFAWSLAVALGAVICLLLAFLPTGFHKKRVPGSGRDSLPNGGPLELGPTARDQLYFGLAASTCPRPRLRPRQAGVLAALVGPWSVLLWFFALTCGGLILGDSSGVALGQQLDLAALGFVSLALGAVVVPILFQSDARGASGLLLSLGVSSVWLVESDRILSLADEFGIWSRMGEWGVLPKWIVLSQAGLVLFPVLAVVGAGLSVLASGIARDESGRRIGGLLGWAAMGCFALPEISRLPPLEALALATGLSVFGVLFVEIAPSGGVGRVRSPLSRLLSRLGRLATILILAGMTGYLLWAEPPYGPLLQLRATELSGMDEARLATWKIDRLRLHAVFERPLTKERVWWSRSGALQSGFLEQPSPRVTPAYVLAQGLCPNPERVARLRASRTLPGEESLFEVRAEWGGRNLWPWDEATPPRTYDLIDLGELRLHAPEEYEMATQEALTCLSERLSPAGILTLSVDLASASREVLEALLDTFGVSFHWGAMWIVDGALCLTGSATRPARLLATESESSASAMREEYGLSDEATLLGHFLGELGNRGTARLKDREIQLLLSGAAGERQRALNLGMLYGRATLAPAEWEVGKTALGRLAVQGYRVFGQARIAKAWVDHYRETAPRSLAERTWEGRLVDALLELKMLLSDDPEARRFVQTVRVEEWRRTGLLAIHTGEYANAVGALLQATVAEPQRADLQLLLAASLGLAGNPVASEAALRRVRDLSRDWQESKLATELAHLGFAPEED